MSEGIIDSLLPSVDSILGIRDSIGAVIKPTFFLTRTWYTDATYRTLSNGIEGFPKDVIVKLLPSPKITEITQDIKAREGGAVKNGDIMLDSVSRSKFKESDLDGSSPSTNIEKLYVVGDKIYQVVKVAEKYLTWRIVLKELTNQTRY